MVRQIMDHRVDTGPISNAELPDVFELEVILKTGYFQISLGWEGVQEKLEVGEACANRIDRHDCLEHLKGPVDTRVSVCVWG